MKFRFKQAAPAAVALAAALTLSACGAAAPSAQETDLTVYNAQHESMTQAWVDEFTAETGITVTLRNGKDTEMSNQIIQEGDSSPADLFITENSPAMTQVEKAGLFADIPADVKKQVPAAYRPSSNKWTGVAARATVFVYNKDKLNEAELPKSLLDLQKPEWKDRWGASPSGADFQAIVSAVLELEGEEATAQWLKGMKENFKAYPNNGAVLKAVNTGEVDGGIIYHYYYIGDQSRTGENSDNVGQHYFRNQDPGAFVSISGGGILKSSGNAEDAAAFLTFITGRKGQEVLQKGSDFEYPVGSNVPAHEDLVPLKELEAPAVDAAKLNSEKVIGLMTDAGLL